MKLPLLSAKELIAILTKLGFEEIRQRGSHKYFRHSDGRTTVVPVHPGRAIGRGLLRRIIKEIEISREDFLKHV
mgnify:CR=1 FL=1